MAANQDNFVKQSADTGSDLLALLERVSGTSPLDVQAVRFLVEPYAAQSAASTASSVDLALIRDTHLNAVRTTEMEAFERLDGEFHRLIFAATRNGLLSCLYEMLRIIRSESAWVDIKRRSFSEARRQKYCVEHAKIVDALLSRNPTAAAQAMQSHLETVSSNLFSGGGNVIIRPREAESA